MTRILGICLALGVTACGSDDAENNTTGGIPVVDDGGSGGSPGADAAATVPAGPEATIPQALEPCPTLATGLITLMGQQVELFVGERREDKKAPVLFYWHGTGSVSAEARAFMSPQIDEIVADGGLVASFTTSTATGEYTGPFVWYSDDFGMADTILACAVQELNIDTQRIYSAGCSAGGLQASAMAYRRSSYIAAIMPNSGGIGEPVREVLEDPSHVPSVITTHGAPGQDVVVIDFSVTSATLVREIRGLGGFALDCNHGGGHCGATPEVVAAQWQFLKDHPFGVQEDPYASGLPASFPSYCQ